MTKNEKNGEEAFFVQLAHKSASGAADNAGASKTELPICEFYHSFLYLTLTRLLSHPAPTAYPLSPRLSPFPTAKTISTSAIYVALLKGRPRE